MIEIQAGIEEIRPGRRLFVRQWILDGDGRDDGQTKQTIASAPRSSSMDKVDLQLVMVHGMCATELQYHQMLHAIEKEMILLLDKNNDTTNNNNKTTTMTIHCILYDMVGCGQSPVVPDWEAYSRNEHIQDLQAIVKRGRDSSLLSKKGNNKIPTILVAHSYGPSIVLSWLASLQQQQQQQEKEALVAADDDDFNIHGLIFLSTSLRDDELPHPDGGMWLFHYLPLSILKCMDPLLKADFCHRAVHAKHTTLKQVMLEQSPRNDMYMVQAFHRNAIWATQCDLQTALQVLAQQQQSSSSTISASGNTTIRCLVVHGADDGIIDIRQGQKLVNYLLQQQQRQDSSQSDKSNHDDAYDDDTRNDDDGGGTKLIVIPEASHMIMLEQPIMVARAILEYIQELIPNVPKSERKETI